MIFEDQGAITVPAGTSAPIAVEFADEHHVRPTVYASTEGNSGGLAPVITDVTTTGFGLRLATVRTTPVDVAWWTSTDPAVRAAIEAEQSTDEPGGDTTDGDAEA